MLGGKFHQGFNHLLLQSQQKILPSPSADPARVPREEKSFTVNALFGVFSTVICLSGDIPELGLVRLVVALLSHYDNGWQD